MASKEKNKGNKSKTRADRADRHKLYQQSVQCVEAEIDFVDATFRSLRGRDGRYLREDFCGTANTACEWVRRRKDNVAVAVDFDEEVLAWGEKHNRGGLKPAARERIELIHGNVLEVNTRPVDIVLAMNFSYWCLAERAALRRYFRRVRETLVSDGVFFLDCYGGWESQKPMRERTKIKDFTYVWNQVSYNPVTGEQRCQIEFLFPDGSKLKPAFTYTWRLWTLPEIRELLADAGFSRVQVWWQMSEDDDEDDFQVVNEADSESSWVCYITAEA